MEILLLMPISTIINENCNINNVITEKRDKRKQQYIDSLTKLSSYINSSNNIKNKIDILLIDNTTTKIDEDIKKILDNISGCDYTVYNGNSRGKFNKGAGLIDVWEKYKDVIKKYKYIIHFEPRQMLINNAFINNIVNNPKDKFLVIDNKKHPKHFYTGLFCISSEYLLDFLESYSSRYIVFHKLSIEYLLYNFMENKSYNYDTVDKLNLIRHDPYTNISTEY